MLRFFYFFSTPYAMVLACLAMVLCVCCSSCGTAQGKCVKTHEGRVYKTANYGCAAYN